MVTPSEESRRLSDLYAGMTDGELEKIAADGSSLTETAREALNAEIQTRHLNAAVAVENPSESEVEFRGLVAVRKFRDLPEALLAKGSLESAGIECFLGDDNMVRMDWFISNLLGGVKLLVKTEDAEEARQLLNQPIPEDMDVEGVGDYRSPHCPKCHSLDVTFEELNKPIAYLSAYVGLPLPVHRKAWKCHSCGQEWDETDATDAVQP